MNSSFLRKFKILMSELSIHFSDSLSYDNEFSYHSIIYIGSGLLFLTLLLIRTFRDRRYPHLTSKIRLHKAITLLVCSFILQRFVDAAVIIIVEVWQDYVPKIVLDMTQLVSDIIYLWNITYSYMVVMSISHGWCVARITLSPNERQKVVLISAAMMLCEVLLVGDSLSPISLLVATGYLACAKVFLNQVAFVNRYLNGQLTLLQRVIFILLRITKDYLSHSK